MKEQGTRGKSSAAGASLRAGLLMLLSGGLASATYGQATRPPGAADAASAARQHRHEAEGPPRAATVGPRRDLTARPGTVTLAAAQVDIPDVTVLDQHGRRLRLYSDLMKGKVVVLSFFFTSCVDVCPAQGAALTRLQKHLGERAGREVFFVSISKDPATDTPERLRWWAKSYGVGPGMTLVTGEEGVIRKVVRDFTGESLGTSTHLPLILIGNDRTGKWSEAFAMLKTEELTRQIDALSRPAAR